MIPYLYHLEKMVRNVFWACSDGWFPVSRIFYVRTCVKFTFANKIMAMHERSLVSVKVEPRSTCRLSSALFILVFILFTWLKFKCVNVHSQKRVSGNQPWVQLCANISLFRSRSDRLISKFFVSKFCLGGLSLCGRTVNTVSPIVPKCTNPRVWW